MEVQIQKVIIVLLVTFSSATYDFVLKPEFSEKPQDLNITAYVGQTSRLPCSVKHLSGKRVSWIRQRDLQVLSTGRLTFSTDLRISVLPGTRFKLRSQRDLNLQGTSLSDGGLITKERLNVRTSYDYEEEDKKVEEHNQVIDKISETLCRKSKRRKRRVGLGQFVGKITDPWEYQSSNCILFHKNKRRHKKEVSITNKENNNEMKSKQKDKSQTHRKEESKHGTIAIFPQGPNSIVLDSKTRKLVPNYIDSVWEPEDYTLQIKYTKIEDAGTYMCQINTEPRISQVAVLNVVHMRAEIVGSLELFVKAGNPVTLSCRVNHGSLSPGFILWYKGKRLVEYESSGGRIQVQTGEDGVSHLYLKSTQPRDSSNYTCSPAGGEPASLILSVIVDERQAAMQQGNHCPTFKSSLVPLLYCTTFLMEHPCYPTENLQLVPCCIFFHILALINPFSISWDTYTSSITLLFIFLLLYHVEPSMSHLYKEYLVTTSVVYWKKSIFSFYSFRCWIIILQEC
ncbi:uncharacterized protein [Palaemon carinicauda]|uniref:uncharacterized protein n=1 Tax=Palaemon carinicauda TaxID=392227 RepID=UPI0035B62F83